MRALSIFYSRELYNANDTRCFAACQCANFHRAALLSTRLDFTLFMSGRASLLASLPMLQIARDGYIFILRHSAMPLLDVRLIR